MIIHIAVVYKSDSRSSHTKMPTVLDEALILSEEFDRLLEKDIPSYGPCMQYLRLSGLRINTMTVVCYTNLENCNSHIPTWRAYIQENPIEDGIVLSEKSMGKNVLIFKWPQKWGPHLMQTKNISAKVFGNGSIHITGVTAPAEAVLIADFLCRYFQTTFSDAVHPNKEKTGEQNLQGCVTRMEICMIQSNFDLGVAVSLPEAHESWKEEGTRTVFNVEKHRALNVKFEDTHKSLSAFIFSSGKVLITGARTPDHLFRVYKRVTAFFDRPFDNIVQLRTIIVKVPKKRGRKRKAENALDYNLDLSDIMV